MIIIQILKNLKTILTITFERNFVSNYVNNSFECPKAVPPIHCCQKTTVLIGIEICFVFMFFTEEA